MRAVLISLISLLLLFSIAEAGDSNRIIALEQDVRNLERVVGNLEREVRELRRGGNQDLRTLENLPSQQDPPSTDWVSASKWKRIRLGMSELEVIEVLGKPSSVRGEGESRLLLYAMEIGAAGFLGGNVRLRNREVVEVQIPVLK